MITARVSIICFELVRDGVADPQQPAYAGRCPPDHFVAVSAVQDASRRPRFASRGEPDWRRYGNAVQPRRQPGHLHGGWGGGLGHLQPTPRNRSPIKVFTVKI